MSAAAEEAALAVVGEVLASHSGRRLFPIAGCQVCTALPLQQQTVREKSRVQYAPLVVTAKVMSLPYIPALLPASAAQGQHRLPPAASGARSPCMPDAYLCIRVPCACQTRKSLAATQGEQVSLPEAAGWLVEIALQPLTQLTQPPSPAACPAQSSPALGMPTAALAALQAIQGLAAALTGPGPPALDAGVARPLAAGLRALLERPAGVEALASTMAGVHRWFSSARLCTKEKPM